MNIFQRAIATFVPACLLVSGCAVTADSPSESTSETKDALSIFDWTQETRIGTWSSYRMNAIVSTGPYAYMVHAGGGTGSTDLWWGYFDGTSWKGDWQIPNQWTSDTPSLGFTYSTTTLARMYMAYTHGTAVYLSKFNFSTKTWSQGAGLPFQSAGAPALAGYNGILYMVSVDPATHQLHMHTLDASEQLSDDIPLAFQYSWSKPSLAVFQNRLYMVHQAGSGSAMVYNSFDGTSWGADHVITHGLNGGNQLMSHPPTIAAFGSTLHLLHNEPSTGDEIWWSYFDGTNWANEVSLPNMLGQPALAATFSKLVMSHDSTASNRAIWYSTYVGP